MHTFPGLRFWRRVVPCRPGRTGLPVTLLSGCSLPAPPFSAKGRTRWPPAAPLVAALAHATRGRQRDGFINYARALHYIALLRAFVAYLLQPSCHSMRRTNSAWSPLCRGSVLRLNYILLLTTYHSARMTFVRGLRRVRVFLLLAACRRTRFLSYACGCVCLLYVHRRGRRRLFFPSCIPYTTSIYCGKRDGRRAVLDGRGGRRCLATAAFNSPGASLARPRRRTPAPYCWRISTPSPSSTPSLVGDAPGAWSRVGRAGHAAPLPLRRGGYFWQRGFLALWRERFCALQPPYTFCVAAGTVARQHQQHITGGGNDNGMLRRRCGFRQPPIPTTFRPQCTAAYNGCGWTRRAL